MACCDATASGPEGVVECAFGVVVVEAFGREPFVVVVVGVVVVESVVVFAAYVAAVEIAGVEGDDAEWEERLAIAVQGLGTDPG